MDSDNDEFQQVLIKDIEFKDLNRENKSNYSINENLSNNYQSDLSNFISNLSKKS
jgi:hypothetical protein